MQVLLLQKIYFTAKSNELDFDSQLSNVKLKQTTLTLSSGGHLNRLMKVCCMFFANLGAKTSLSVPNWCLDCRTIESITYNPGTLYSGLHFSMNFSTLCTTCLQNLMAFMAPLVMAVIFAFEMGGFTSYSEES